MTIARHSNAGDSACEGLREGDLTVFCERILRGDDAAARRLRNGDSHLIDI